MLVCLTFARYSRILSIVGKFIGVAMGSNSIGIDGASTSTGNHRPYFSTKTASFGDAPVLALSFGASSFVKSRSKRPDQLVARTAAVCNTNRIGMPAVSGDGTLLDESRAICLLWTADAFGFQKTRADRCDEH